MSQGKRQLSITVLEDRLAVCRLHASAPLPDWAGGARGFTSITRATDELSIIVAEKAVPAGIQSQSGWRLLKLHGPFDFSLTGIVAAIGDPLRDAGVSMLWISTFDTDHLLVQQRDLVRCVEALKLYGHQVETEPSDRAK